METRLQKIIADRGFCSRRKAEEYIQAGKVKVDGALVTELGNKFEEDTCIVEVDGTVLRPLKKTFHYLKVNKPLGFICSMNDPQGRKTVDLLVPTKYGRLFPVGRLDINSSGLLLMTDDGDFANLVMHPSSSLGKTYIVTVDGILKSEEKEKLAKGILLEDGMTAPAEVKTISVWPDKSVFEITIHEGRNRQIRRMVEALGHKTYALKRVQVGPIKLGDLPRGAYEEIPLSTVEEMKRLCRENKKNNTYKKA